jgi:tol-pal system protein YbgF
MTGTTPYGMMPYSQYGNMYPMPSTGGDYSQYSMPYTVYPYDQSQQYGQYGQMYPQQGQGYYQQQYGYETADQAYNQAKQAFDSKDYWTAMMKFQEVAMRFPQSDLVDNAYYWTGEIYYAWKNFPAAIQSFQTVLYSYPQGNKAPDAYVKMGFAYAEMRQYNMAKSILNDVASRYQNNARIRGLALKKLNELTNQY